MAWGSEDMAVGGLIGAIIGFVAAVVIGSQLPPTSGSAGINVTEYHPEGYHPDSNVVENQGYFF